MDFSTASLVAVAQIIWINIILSGDNAVVIALACRGLPPPQRRMGMMLGAGVAILLRVIFTIAVAKLLATPFLKIIGALLLFWIAIKLVVENVDEQDDKIASHDKLWKAVQTVAIADIVMSLDNVLAIAAVAKDNNAMLIFGLVISIPLIIAGAALIMELLNRFPILVWAGAGLLGWVAGEMLVTDPAFVGWLESLNPRYVMPDLALPPRKNPIHAIEWGAAGFGTLFVLGASWWLKRREAAHAS